MRLSSLIVAVIFAVLVVPCFAQSAASVVFVSGAAVIVGKDGLQRAVVRGGDLGAGETIDTIGSRVQLRFADGASMSLQPATRFKIEDFRFVAQSGKADVDDRGFFSLLKGGFRTITGLIGKEKREQYRVNTAVATIGIRGTDYSAQLGEAGLSVSTFAGLVEVCNGAGCVQVGPGQSAQVSDPNGRPVLQGGQSGGPSGQGGLGSTTAVPGGPPPPVISPEITAPASQAPVRHM